MGSIIWHLTVILECSLLDYLIDYASTGEDSSRLSSDQDEEVTALKSQTDRAKQAVLNMRNIVPELASKYKEVTRKDAMKTQNGQVLPIQNQDSTDSSSLKRPLDPLKCGSEDSRKVQKVSSLPPSRAELMEIALGRSPANRRTGETINVSTTHGSMPEGGATKLPAKPSNESSTPKASEVIAAHESITDGVVPRPSAKSSNESLMPESSERIAAPESPPHGVVPKSAAKSSRERSKLDSSEVITSHESATDGAVTKSSHESINFETSEVSTVPKSIPEGSVTKSSEMPSDQRSKLKSSEPTLAPESNPENESSKLESSEINTTLASIPESGREKLSKEKLESSEEAGTAPGEDTGEHDSSVERQETVTIKSPNGSTNRTATKPPRSQSEVLRNPRKFINWRVAKSFEDFDGDIFFGTITKYQPPSAEGENDALWYVNYDDGDAEDFDVKDMIEGLRLYHKNRREDDMMQSATAE